MKHGGFGSASGSGEKIYTISREGVGGNTGITGGGVMEGLGIRVN
jgi:hypothetical protein